jgi:hypothetical protein
MASLRPVVTRMRGQQAGRPQLVRLNNEVKHRADVVASSPMKPLSFG